MKSERMRCDLYMIAKDVEELYRWFVTGKMTAHTLHGRIKTIAKDMNKAAKYVKKAYIAIA